MERLNSQAAWKKWATKINRSQPQSPIDPPVEYPCYGYLVVLSYGYEEEMAKYLYGDDIRRMAKALRVEGGGGQQ